MTPKIIGFDEKEFKEQINELSEIYDSTIRDAKERSQNQPSTNQNSNPKPTKSIQGLTEQEWRDTAEYYGY